MMETTRTRTRAGLIAAVLAVGVVGTAYLVWTKPAPARYARVVRIPEVVVIPVEPCTFSSPVVGHGTVQAKRQVKIVPEVGGRLVQVHEDLAVGKIIKMGELLFEIDARSYQLRVEQAEAEIKRLNAELDRRQEEKSSLEARLALAEELCRQTEKNLEREKELLEKDATLLVEVEKAENAHLRQRDVAEGYRSQLALIPHLTAETKSLLDLKRAQLAEAERQVERTKIYCPFDARVESISASQSQVVIASFAIASLTDVEALELVAGVDPRELRWTELRSFARAVGEDIGTPPEATIIWSVHDQQYTWRGPVTRLERLDEVTRTARVVVEIRDVMDGLTLEGGAARPPLSIGMFCRVEIPAEPLPNALVVPRSALHELDAGRSKCVYVFEPVDDAEEGADGRLALRRVPALRTVGDEVLVSYERGGKVGPSDDDPASVCELRPGEEVIVSALPKAVEGMRLRRRIGSPTPNAPEKEQVARQGPAPPPVVILGLGAPIPGDS